MTYTFQYDVFLKSYHIYLHIILLNHRNRKQQAYLKKLIFSSSLPYCIICSKFTKLFFWCYIIGLDNSSSIYCLYFSNIFGIHKKEFIYKQYGKKSHEFNFRSTTYHLSELVQMIPFISLGHSFSSSVLTSVICWADWIK